jgi:hypothetical protein
MKKEVSGKFFAAAAALVIIHTFFEDFAVLADLPWAARRALLYSGFLFDLFFSAEFLIRLYAAALNRRTGDYFLRRGGWIDFLASVPLIVFGSGPALLGLLAGGLPLAGAGGFGVFGLLRMPRTLRLLRFLKACKRHPESRAVGPTIAVFVLALLAFDTAGALLGFSAPEDRPAERYAAAAAFVSDMTTAGAAADSGGTAAFARVERNLLLVKKGGKTLYARFGEAHFRDNFGPFDYIALRDGGADFFFSLKPLHSGQARDGLSYYFILLALLLALRVNFSKHG